MDYENRGNMQQSQHTPPGQGKAVASLVLGLFAMIVPIPVIDIIAGVVGICLAVSAKRDGYSRGMRTAGFVVSIIGTVIAVGYTLSVLFPV